MKYYCNPVNINYRYQFNIDPRKNELYINREAADPSMIFFHGTYYIFASMTLGVWTSKDLVNWENHRLPETLPLYDYAPDVRIMGNYLYLSASKNDTNCSHFRTMDILNGPYEELPGTFPFWDPNMFVDEDERVYFYWGCTNTAPVYGVELDPETMNPIGEKKELIFGNPWTKGFERIGEDNAFYPKSEEEIDAALQGFISMQGSTMDQVPQELLPMLRGMFSQKPYIEGAWMDKFQGRYYLQYACPGTEYNTYADAVYVGDNPLGPFTLAENNPYSYHPGGFMPGAGHGSTMRDLYGNLWHTATMRISVQHNFERRVGIWPAGVDAEGELFCNQRYGDWPCAVSGGRENPWRDPSWFLLSYHKSVKVSSFCEGKGAENAVDENAQTWWRAAKADPGQWIELNLEKKYSVNAIQINFADDKIDILIPGELRGKDQPRYIEERDMVTRWKLEGSLDGKTYFILEDKTNVKTDLSHDLVVIEEGVEVQYVRLTILEVPYQQNPCISGFRVFGIGDGTKPEIPEYKATCENDLDLMVKIAKSDAVGYNILWGSTPDKLYHSYLTYQNTQRIGALVKEREYYVRVDAFNESGITKGKTVKLIRE